MAAITDLSDIINLMTGGGAAPPQRPGFFFSERTTLAAAPTWSAGRMTSLWTVAKSNGANGLIPTTVAACDSTLLGALPVTNAGEGRELWLTGLDGTMSQPGVLMLYDRLLHIGGLSGANASPQTVGGSLTRHTDGIGNEIWVEIYGGIGTSAATFQVVYVNHAGVQKISPNCSLGGTGNREAGRIIRVPLGDGDKGVQGVSALIGASTGSAGNVGITIARPIVMGNCDLQGSSFGRDLVAGMPGPVKLVDGACLALAVMSASNTAGFGYAQAHILEK